MSSFSPLGPASNAGAYAYRSRPSPSTSLQKLASGCPINAGADGSAVPVIPDKLRESIAGAARTPGAAAGGSGTRVSFEA